MSDPLPPTSRPSMRRAARVLVPVGAVMLAFGGFAVAQAASDSGVDTPHDLAERGLDGSNPTVDDDTSPATAATNPTTADAVDLPDGTTQTFAAGAAGSVTLSRSGAVLSVVAVGTNPGWTATIEAASGPEVEVEFHNGTARTDLDAELEDGAVRVRVRERTEAESDDDNEVAPPTTPTTRVDNSGPGSVNSGPGSVNSGRDDEGDDDAPDHEVGDDSGSHSGSGAGSGSASSGSGSSGSGSSGSGSGSGSGGSGSGHSGSDD